MVTRTRLHHPKPVSENQAIADARWSTVKSTYTSLFDLQLPDSPTLMDIMQHEWQDQDVDALA